MHCGDCRFWHQPAEQCRRNAPAPLRGQQGDPSTAWPHVASEDWCGEYQPGYIDRTSIPPEARAQQGAQQQAQH